MSRRPLSLLSVAFLFGIIGLSTLFDIVSGDTLVRGPHILGYVLDILGVLLPFAIAVGLLVLSPLARNVALWLCWVVFLALAVMTFSALILPTSVRIPLGHFSATVAESPLLVMATFAFLAAGGAWIRYVLTREHIRNLFQ